MERNFRKVFQVVHREVIQWFPGHMGKGLKQMQQKLKTVDCVIEVHDARIFASGRNSEFRYTISGAKPNILVLNKKDLVERRMHSKIINKLKQNPENFDQNVILSCSKDQKCDGVKKIIPLAIDLIKNSDRFNRSDEQERSIMIIGVPNVGKSSLTNILRNRHLNKKGASAVGAIAGITRSVLTKIKICEDPLIYLLDTPGVLLPNIRDVEVGLKLALCSCFQDHLVGEDIIADYLLYWMNKNENYKYTELMGVDEPTDDIGTLLTAGAEKMGKTIRIKNWDNTMIIRPDLQTAAKQMIQTFRTGGFGKLCLDHTELITPITQ